MDSDQDDLYASSAPASAPASDLAGDPVIAQDKSPTRTQRGTLSVSVSRQRTRECMQSMLSGDLRMLPALVLCVYNHITRPIPGASNTEASFNANNMQHILGRAAEILTDLTDLVQESERASAILDRKIAKETAPQMIVHVCVFACECR